MDDKCDIHTGALMKARRRQKRPISGTRPPEFIQATISFMDLFLRNKSDHAERVGTELTKFVSVTFPAVLVKKSAVLVPKLRGIRKNVVQSFPEVTSLTSD